MKELLKKLVGGDSLSEEEAFGAIESFLGTEDAVSDAQIGAFLAATATRLPTADELVGAARALRAHMVPVSPGEGIVVDTCGTGGSGLDGFNTSTASAFVVAGAGKGQLKVAKHGNRAATSRCGSADVLEALGVSIDLSPESAERMLQEVGFSFLFAPKHHAATKRVVLIRRELGFRTLFNFLGPLCNPAGATHQVLGVSTREMVPVMAEALQRLGSKRALVVHGEDGLDELTLTANSVVAELGNTGVSSSSLNPEDYGLSKVDFSQIQGSEPAEAAQDVLSLLEGVKGPKRDLVLLNAGAALYIVGSSESIESGVQLAAEAIDSGAAKAVLQRARKLSENA